MDPYLAPLLTYGPLGIFAALFVLAARSMLRREQERGDAAAAEVVRLNTIMQERTIPALVAATQAISASQAILQQLQYRQDIENAAKATRLLGEARQ